MENREQMLEEEKEDKEIMQMTREVDEILGVNSARAA